MSTALSLGYVIRAAYEMVSGAEPPDKTFPELYL